MESAHSSLRGDRGRLRVGLLLDSESAPRWVRRVIRDIQASSAADIVLVVRNVAEAPPRPGVARRLWTRRRHLLYRLYTRLDYRLFEVEPDALEEVSVADLLRDVPVVEVRPTMARFTDTFPPESVSAIRAHELDVALRLGFRILKGDALDIARHGVWSYHHDDPDVIRGGPPGFWEVMRDDPVTGSILQVLTEDLDNGRVLYRSWSATASRFSVRRNNNNNFWKSSAFVLRKLEDLADDGVVEASPPRADDVHRPYSRRLFKPPTNAEMAPLLLGLAARGAGRAYQKARFFEQWALAYRFKSGPSDLNDAMFRFERLVPPRDRFWADPFPVVEDGRYHVFFEEFLYATGKAHISVVEVSRDGVVRPPATVLERDHHLSYPFVFDWDGGRYMIPEAGSTNTVEAYRCVSFPDRWEPAQVLLEAANPHDATLVEEGGLWWMFVNVQPEGAAGNWDELHLFHAETPFGPWRPHRRNPVKSDVRGARPAGRLFRRGDGLYRPSQDCSRRYGYATAINRVTRLTTDDYLEEEVSKNLPEWSPEVLGTHTFNVVDELTTIDYLARRRKRF
jgi:hypothetical protein